MINCNINIYFEYIFFLGANIFLTDVGNCLKLGDFGCAAKIKSQTTMFGELQGFVGTQGKVINKIIKDDKLILESEFVSIHGSGSFYAYDD
jgi:hypothetical protein